MVNLFPYPEVGALLKEDWQVIGVELHLQCMKRDALETLVRQNQHKEQIALYKQVIAPADSTTQNALMQRVLDMAAEQFSVIGVSTPPLLYGLKKPNFHNVPGFMPNSSTFLTPAPTNPSQYFLGI